MFSLVCIYKQDILVLTSEGKSLLEVSGNFRLVSRDFLCFKVTGVASVTACSQTYPYQMSDFFPDFFFVHLPLQPLVDMNAGQKILLRQTRVAVSYFLLVTEAISKFDACHTFSTGCLSSG